MIADNAPTPQTIDEPLLPTKGTNTVPLEIF